MITIQDVSLFYKHNKSILENINLKILPGRIYGLLGKNGEGKTTLLNILSGQLFPDKGICNVSGEVPSCRNISFLQKLFLMPEEQKMPGIKINEYIRMYSNTDHSVSLTYHPIYIIARKRIKQEEETYI